MWACLGGAILKTKCPFAKQEDSFGFFEAHVYFSLFFQLPHEIK